MLPDLQPLPRRRRTPSAAALLLLALGTLLASAGCRPFPTASTAPTIGVERSSPAATTRSPATAAGTPARPPRLRPDRDLGVADGELPDGTTVLDDRYPGVTELDPALREALRRAAEDAGDEGVEIDLNSGWRSRAYQRRLLDEAVSTYGSRAAAARWVATPATSPHVSGDAVDVANADAIAWLTRHGAGYALCRVYANEPWHFELRPGAAEHGCPATYADPTHDPRMRG